MILEFDKFEFNEGINTTVRRGIKNLSVNQCIRLIDKNSSNFIYATILNVKYKRFCDLTDEDIVNEHYIFGRKREILTLIMASIYKNFDTTEIITLIDFKLDKD